jgi:GTP-binding protein HflX
MYETAAEERKAFLIGIKEEDKAKEALALLSLEELASLADTAGFAVVDKIEVQVREVNPATFIGKGKVDELHTLFAENGTNTVVFNMPLLPRVQRNLEEAWGIPVIDREEVILQIFALRAQTKEAKLQVKLAQLQYSRPRLTRMWANLSQQRGGAYGAKGAGETQLELDQRKIDDQILSLKRDLSVVDKERDQQRQSRMRSPIPRAAIVGYTNVGKSSLLNKLAGTDVLVENKLFATLDPTTRQVKLPGGELLLLTDTVGFISNLPTHLVDSFKSTLQEADYADFLIILADAAHPAMLNCYKTTKQVLEDLGCGGKPTIVFANKCDEAHDQIAVAKLKSMVPDLIEGSVKTGENLDKLIAAVTEEIHRLSPLFRYKLPEDRYDLMARLRTDSQVVSVDYTGEGIIVEARVKNPTLARELLPYAIEGKN